MQTPTFLIFPYRELESYCNEFGVRMRAPHNVGSFLRNVNQWI
jgi:hypothetical protein